MARIMTDPEQIKSASMVLKTASEEYLSIAKNLMNAATTMGSAYDSDDNRAFVNQIQGCTEDLNKMAQKLAQQAEILAKQANMYIATTEANIQAVKTLQN